ncbi:indolepyruvate ferredoxin oxidoreductase subunit alpha [Coprothermobacter platensis]|uniref:indolepyruvate ferredoxin oxidoreductase subunit alpha n=1 Tax=Coprothermobacter platensis TaxID=108819 RepID=UPI000365E409|nr:indolepyruvate ferredoxin oxidoreductase subunit alpha [Coprothermobacter platensis]
MPFLDETGSELLLGNEAIARGALESNVACVSAYPGTPSTEVPETLSKYAKKLGVYVEYSTNEKVALEVATAFSWSNLRAMATMKHVGLNVASDTFMSIAYQGVLGGLVILTADDPGMWSSQNEQDNRIYGKFAGVPVIVPSDPQEAKDLTRISFELSEFVGTPVLMRTTTRVSHTRAPVTLGPLGDDVKLPNVRKGVFKPDIPKFVSLPANAKKNHPLVLQRLEKALEFARVHELNKREGFGKVGVITQGVEYLYVKEAQKDLGLDLSILKLDMVYPLDKEVILAFAKTVDVILVVEELEPFLEEMIKAILFDASVSIPVHGKDVLPRVDELGYWKVRNALERVAGMQITYADISQVPQLPPRPPVLCPGCSHRNVFYAIKKLERKAVKPSDIGCYTLGAMDPLKAIDTCIAMGASVGLGSGMAKAQDQRVISTIGDSTFFHTGLPALVNAVYNKSKMTLIVLDNRITAMTGHQPNPSTGIVADGDKGTHLDIETVARGLGADYVKSVDPYDLSALEEAIKEANQATVAVIVAKQPCALIRQRELSRRGEHAPLYAVDEERCTGCRICVNMLGCPALVFDREMKKVHIDEDLCAGCSACAQVCPYNAIYEMDEKGSKNFNVMRDDVKERWQRWYTTLF